MIMVGVPSGDSECWCFLVDKKTFTKITGQPPEKHDVGRHNAMGKYRYMIYPSHVIPDMQGKLVAVSIDAKVLE